MQRKRNVFQNVPANIPGRSAFDLSYEKKFDCDMGELIPVMCDEVVPGDILNIGCEAVIRLMPLVSPALHEVNMYAHYFFVPYRILWDDWEVFITGGEDGDDETTIPTWEPTSYAEGSLWDYLGFPAGVDPDGAYPIDFPRRAYATIWNEFYRDENLQDEEALTNEDILLRNWEKDYFTSALPWQQRGTAPAIPLSGTLHIDGIGKGNTSFQSLGQDVYESGDTITTHYTNHAQISNANSNEAFFVEGTASTGYPVITADLADGVSVDVSDMRLMFQIQRFMERNARGGVRYTEFLRSHFGLSPRDDRLQRPEYIGGSRSPIIISEVLQTSQTDTTPQGTLTGHGISVNQGMVGKYRADEYGLIMGLLSVMPVSLYQQGINRQWLKETRYDFFFPEFVNLSEQAIIQAEIYATAVEAENQTIFGYQGRYDELRQKSNMVVGSLRSTFDYWHISRQFSSAPTLNSDFIECDPRKDIFAAPSVPGMIISFANLIKAFRPLPVVSQPGLIDH